jgi:nicotinate-nucleotide adenylyltransferase
VKLALLGGSFDPVHVGHLSLAESLHRELAYDLVLFIPANDPPHKELSSLAGVEDRLAMLRLASEGRAYIAVDDCELRRGGVSYTIDTIRYITEKYGTTISGKPAIVIGEDLLAGFSTWKDVPGILSSADIVVARRSCEAENTAGNAAQGAPSNTASCAPVFPYPHINLENELVDVSSTLVRKRIADGTDWSSLVPESVYRYIISHTLYEHRNH